MGTTYPSFATPDQYAALTNTDVDPDIQPMLDAASSLIRRYCGWHVSPIVTEDVIVDGRGGYVQTLPTLHLVELLTLDETSCTGTLTSYVGDEIEWSTSGFLRKCSLWTDRLRGIKASISHGFDPDDCGYLATLCASIVARASASPYGEKAQTVGSVSVQYSTATDGSSGGVALSESQMAQLDSLRLFGRP